MYHAFGTSYQQSRASENGPQTLNEQQFEKIDPSKNFLIQNEIGLFTLKRKPGNNFYYLQDSQGKLTEVILAEAVITRETTINLPTTSHEMSSSYYSMIGSDGRIYKIAARQRDTLSLTKPLKGNEMELKDNSSTGKLAGTKGVERAVLGGLLFRRPVYSPREKIVAEVKPGEFQEASDLKLLEKDYWVSPFEFQETSIVPAAAMVPLEYFVSFRPMDLNGTQVFIQPHLGKSFVANKNAQVIRVSYRNGKIMAIHDETDKLIRVFQQKKDGTGRYMVNETINLGGRDITHVEQELSKYEIYSEI